MPLIVWLSERITPAYLQCRGGQPGLLSIYCTCLYLTLSNPDEPAKSTYQPPVTENPPPVGPNPGTRCEMA